MNSHKAELDTLALRTRQGDAGAKAELRKQLEPSMFLLVRRTLKNGASPTGISQRILEECRRVAPAAAAPAREMPTYLMAQVARNLCARLVDRLQTEPVGLQCLRETVLA